ncbi:MAG: integrin alpha [Myxococcota bacterium]
MIVGSASSVLMDVNEAHSAVHFVDGVDSAESPLALYSGEVPSIFSDRVDFELGTYFAAFPDSSGSCGISVGGIEGRFVTRELPTLDVPLTDLEPIVGVSSTIWGRCGDLDADGLEDLCYGGATFRFGPDFLEGDQIQIPLGEGGVALGSDAVFLGSFAMSGFEGGVTRLDLPLDGGPGVAAASGTPRANAGKSVCAGLGPDRDAVFVSGHTADGGRGMGWVVPGDFDGSAPLASIALATVRGDTSDEWFGFSCAVSDLTGDGEPDLIVGSPGRSRSSGSVTVFEGPVAGVLDATTAWARWTGPAIGDGFGTSVITGDFDGDGVTDLAVGAPRSSVTAAAQGTVFVLFGPVPR